LEEMPTKFATPFGHFFLGIQKARSGYLRAKVWKRYRHPPSHKATARQAEKNEKTQNYFNVDWI